MSTLFDATLLDLRAAHCGSFFAKIPLGPLLQWSGECSNAHDQRHGRTLLAYLPNTFNVTKSTLCCDNFGWMRLAMNNEGTPPGQMVDFSTRFADSKLFHQGMALVEETAHYLDGDGRAQSRGLSKPVALTYATESMRLTTRLMQVASWFLIQHAIADNEMPTSEAYSESRRVPLKPLAARRERPIDAGLPEQLHDLIARTNPIYARPHICPLVPAGRDA